MFRTRQAPSPTGYLHLGTVRQILFTKLLAQNKNGQWFLRLEDTDQKRLVELSPQKMLETLFQLNLEPVEGITLKNSSSLDQNVNFNPQYQILESGKYEPYIQSKRLRIYHQHAQNLIDQKLAYWSYLTLEEREDLQSIKKINKKAINYFKASQQKDEDRLFQKVEFGIKDEKNPVLRYRLQREGTVKCNDLLVGKTSFDLNLEEDFGLLKSDGFPTYHFAHLIDDRLMETSLVIRAQEWYPSIAKHTVMFQDYWNEVPDYLHLPFILGETGNKKLSKRDSNVDMQSYLNQGYLPEAIINYLAFLGWNPGTDKEIYC